MDVQETALWLKAQKDAAFHRCEQAGKVYAEAAKTAAIARANFARILLLEVAAEHPEITGFSWEVSWEYDDEGGYYASTNIHPYGAETSVSASSYDIWAELLEAQQYLDEEAIPHLGEQDKEVTVEELKRMTL